jgi:hypothetical protein
MGIAEKLEILLGRHNALYELSVDTLLEVDREARLEAKRL